MNNFFEKYPNAKPLWKVGDKTFLNYQKQQAVFFANQSGQKLEEMVKQEVVKESPKPRRRKKTDS